jgi:hypothetical protein
MRTRVIAETTPTMTFLHVEASSKIKECANTPMENIKSVNEITEAETIKSRRLKLTSARFRFAYDRANR